MVKFIEAIDKGGNNNIFNIFNKNYGWVNRMKCIDCSNLNHCINDIKKNRIGRNYGKCIHDKRLKIFTKFSRDGLFVRCSKCNGKGSIYNKNKVVEYSYQRVEICTECDGDRLFIKLE